MKMDCVTVLGYKKIQKWIINSSGVLIVLLALLSSCAKDPDNLGRDLLPSSDSIIVKIDSTTSIKSHSITGKRILSSANEFYILGSMRDSIFGNSRAGLLTQFHPTLLISADSIRTVDSLILYLSSAGFYGDSLSPLTLHVFELNASMQLDSNYFSDINPLEYYDPAKEIASCNYVADSTILRIKITDSSILDKFESMPDSIFKDRTDFAGKFYGLYLSVDQTSEKGSFSYFNMSNSDTRLTMYYNGDQLGDTISYAYEMSFTSIAAKANVFTHDYAGFPVATNLDLVEAGDTSIYVEGLAGVSGRISFPELDEWRNKGLISINKAELILPVDSMVYPELSKDDYPSNLLLFSVKENEEYAYLYDYRIDNSSGSAYFDGTYHANLNAYVFNIGFHLQSYISGKIDNSDLVIVNRQSNSSARRVILKGATAEKSPIKLKVTYTELF